MFKKLSKRWRPAWIPALVAVMLLAAVLPSQAATGCLTDQGFPRTVVDGLGNEIELERPPQRIFSAGLAMDSILLTLVDPERVVGVTRFAADPSYSRVADKVADHMVQIEHLSPETVLAAQPDIVLVASYSNQDAVKQIRDLGLKVYTFTGFSSVLDVIENIERMAEITGCEPAAERLIADTFERYGRVAAKIAMYDRPTVLSWDTWGSTAGRETTMHDIIQMAGGVNAAAKAGITGWKEIDVEAIVAMNPDVIVTAYGEDFVQKILQDEVLQSVTAVRTGRVYHLEDTDALDHHIFRAIEQLARKLHPEAFE